MPDLVTHLCSALLPKAITGGRHVGPFAVGVVLPDLLARVPGLMVGGVRRLGVAVPESTGVLFEIFHMPVGIVLACLLLARAFVAEQRAAVFGWLCAGGFLHLALDVLQDHHGEGYYLLFPLSTFRWELGWIGPEATVPWAPWLALVTALAWAIRLGVRRRR